MAELKISGRMSVKKLKESAEVEDVEDVEEVEDVEDSSCDEPKDGHEYVDLGLSVKWATCNVGASKPEEYGDYFAWGETSPKEEYTDENSLTYGKQMSDIAGNAQYDAARANWGGNWRLPTKAERNELTDKCTWEWTTQNGVKGYKVTGPNGNSIFLPAAGYRNGSSLNRAGSDGHYWSSTPCRVSDLDLNSLLNQYCGQYWSSTPLESLRHNACNLSFDSGKRYVDYGDRNGGQSVRPVLE